MCRHLFYVPLFQSMDLHFVLCAVISVYGPLLCSMDCYSGLCAIVLFYGPLSRSMCLHSFLCFILPFYVPSSLSLARLLTPTSSSLPSPFPLRHLLLRLQLPCLLLLINRRSLCIRPTSIVSHSNAIARHAKIPRTHCLSPCLVHHTTANLLDIL